MENEMGKFDKNNFIEALEELFAVYFGMPVNKKIERKVEINEGGDIKEIVIMDFDVHPFINTSKFIINVNLDQKNNLLNKF